MKKVFQIHLAIRNLKTKLGCWTGFEVVSPSFEKAFSEEGVSTESPGGPWKGPLLEETIFLSEV